MTTTITSKDRLEAYLREHGVSFVLRHHPTAYTAQEVAECEHVPGKQMAKPVIVIADGQPVMLVVPASHMVQVSKLGITLGAHDVRLADEREVEAIFSDCEAGALPPFGNLYGLQVYVDRALTEDDHIVFRAGTHTETMCIPYAEFARLVQPVIVAIARHR